MSENSCQRSLEVIFSVFFSIRKTSSDIRIDFYVNFCINFKWLCLKVTNYHQGFCHYLLSLTTLHSPYKACELSLIKLFCEQSEKQIHRKRFKFHPVWMTIHDSHLAFFDFSAFCFILTFKYIITFYVHLFKATRVFGMKNLCNHFWHFAH